MGLLFDAHALAARNNPNASKIVCSMASLGSGSFVQGVAAAILTLGSEVGKHGPTLGARKLLRGEYRDKPLGVYPGFGNTFYKDCIDPSFVPVYDYIRDNWPDYYAKVEHIREELLDNGKTLFPNPAMITAIVCEILGVKDGLECVLLIVPRLQEWAREAQLLREPEVSRE